MQSDLPDLPDLCIEKILSEFIANLSFDECSYYMYLSKRWFYLFERKMYPIKLKDYPHVCQKCNKKVEMFDYEHVSGVLFEGYKFYRLDDYKSRFPLNARPEYWSCPACFVDGNFDKIVVPSKRKCHHCNIVIPRKTSFLDPLVDTFELVFYHPCSGSKKKFYDRVSTSKHKNKICCCDCFLSLRERKQFLRKDLSCTFPNKTTIESIDKLDDHNVQCDVCNNQNNCFVLWELGVCPEDVLLHRILFWKDRRPDNVPLRGNICKNCVIDFIRQKELVFFWDNVKDKYLKFEEFEI